MFEQQCRDTGKDSAGQELDAGELVKGEISETLKAENCKKEVKKKTAIIKQKELAVV